MIPDTWFRGKYLLTRILHGNCKLFDSIRQGIDNDYELLQKMVRKGALPEVMYSFSVVCSRSCAVQSSLLRFSLLLMAVLHEDFYEIYCPLCWSFISVFEDEVFFFPFLFRYL